MARGATARLFAALDLPAEVREQLARWARAIAAEPGPLPALRVLEPQSLHLTLCFLGSRPVAEIDALAVALERCAQPLGELAVGAPLLLPPRRPRSLAVAIGDPVGTLESLHGCLLVALSEASGWEPDRRRLRPHVTVARMRSGAGGGVGAPVLPVPTPQLTFTPHALALYRSWLEPAGARYEEIARCELVPELD
jgi:RNA 2',3'-cyclic 3'-phosphodiesterase